MFDPNQNKVFEAKVTCHDGTKQNQLVKFDLSPCLVPILECSVSPPKGPIGSTNDYSPGPKPVDFVVTYTCNGN